MTGTNQTGSVFEGGALAQKMVADTNANIVQHDSGEGPHSLWQDVYENPGKTALVVGGAALAVAAVIAGKPALAKLLPEGRTEVLLVEDSPYFGKAIKQALEEQGSKVTWLAGAKDTEALKSGMALAPDGHVVSVHLERFKAAFVDGDLTGKVTGADVVEQLSAEHVASVGISSQPVMNKEMLDHGAIAAGLKPSVFGALVNKDVTVAGLLREPGAVQGQIDGYQTAYKADHKIADRASAMLTEAMEEKPTWVDRARKMFHLA